LDDELVSHCPTEVVLLFELDENEVLSTSLIILNKHVLRNIIGFEHPTLRPFAPSPIEKGRQKPCRPFLINHFPERGKKSKQDYFVIAA
jgi:hypothetical protein